MLFVIQMQPQRVGVVHPLVWMINGSLLSVRVFALDQYRCSDIKSLDSLIVGNGLYEKL